MSYCPRQTAQDRPTLVARVFCAKLEDLKVQLLKRNIIGEVGAHVYVVDFQKRGLPNVYFFLIMRYAHKMTNPDDYYKIVCAEIPDPITYSEMHDLVKNHMIHGPRGSLQEKSPHMEGVPKKCRFRYPRKFNDKTSQDPPLWMALQIHLPNQQLVRFKYGDRMEDIVEREKDKNSTFMAFFEKNKEDSNARKYMYKDFPKHFTWNLSTHRWSPRKLKSMIGRLVYANPAEGERYYLRLLLCHITGPTCFEDIYTINGVLHPTFQNTALERGLIDTDDNLSQCLAEASLFQFPNTLRRLLATILIFCEPGDVQSLNPNWKFAYDEIMRRMEENIMGMFFIDGPGGTGKTFLYRALLANICAHGLIALATTTSGVAANNMPGRRTAHSRFKIPLNLENNLTCKINKQSGADHLLREAKVGDGNEETVDESFIRIPDDMDIKYTNKANSVDALIDAIIPSLQFNEDDSKFIISRVILTTKNESVDEINDQMIERFSGEKKVCYSYDEAEDYSNNLYLTKFLNSLNVSGLPPHYLWLKIGCPMILLRNIDPSNGLRNCTKLICRAF
uniref:ATP-dependent DNA helicase n=1 Tax=Lactuca sativa TaxID=4236 RepID=A0A9R1VCJ7_LACSA|nr:hypothetical protein LSAT_V11C600309800 [Lactuca sativa]